MKASNERLIELRENVHRLQVLSISNQDKYDKELKRLDQNLIRKTMDLDNHLMDLSQRIRSLEDELNEDDGGDTSGVEKRSSQYRRSASILKKTGFTSIGEDDDKVNFDDELPE